MKHNTYRVIKKKKQTDNRRGQGLNTKDKKLTLKSRSPA